MDEVSQQEPGLLSKYLVLQQKINDFGAGSRVLAAIKENKKDFFLFLIATRTREPVPKSLILYCKRWCFEIWAGSCGYG